MSWRLEKKYQIEISDRFAALENLNDNQDINRAWKNIREIIKTSAKESPGLYELKQHNRSFEEESLVHSYLDHRKQAKMRWLHDPKQSYVDDLNNVRR